MSLHTIKLLTPEEPVLINFNSEVPYCKLTSFFAGKYTEKDLLSNGLQLYCKIYEDDLKERGYPIKVEFHQQEHFPHVNIITKLDLTRATQLEIYYEIPEDKSDFWDDFKIPISLCYLLTDYIDVLDQTHLFERHLKDRGNHKILFSGQFGQGKTTFLNDFFDNDRSPYYNVFKLYPINYSVASNEDIFKYIKSDILLQLMESNVDFENIGPSFGTSFKQYFTKNPHTVIGAFLRTIPKIGKNAQSLFDSLNKIKDDICLYHEKAQKDELKESQEFINALIEQEGSIYEDNFITVLIRNLLNQCSERLPFQKKVLIIDDLDRMDPDHIFRILNVFSAHYDSQNNHVVYAPDKFGFDKIILVCDYKNLYQIYKHRYGAKTDFKGYISKYYSRKVFYYNNTKNYQKLLDPAKYFIKNITHESEHLNWFKIILLPLVEANVVCLRDLIKMLQVPFQEIVQEIGISGHNYKNRLHGSYWMPTLYLLDVFLNEHELMEGVKLLNYTHFKTLEHKFDPTQHGLELVTSLSSVENNTVTIAFEKSRLKLTISGNYLNTKNWAFKAEQEKNDTIITENNIKLSLNEYKEILQSVFQEYYLNKRLFLKD